MSEKKPFDDVIADESPTGLLSLEIERIDMSTDVAYRVQENTGSSTHPSVDDVIELALERAADPRPEEDPDAHFDRYVSAAVETHSESAVTECIRLVLVEGFTQRSAGVKAFAEEDYVRGIVVGVASHAYLRELLGERTVES